MKRTYQSKKRNDRLWFEDRELAVLQKSPGEEVLVSIAGMDGDSREGETLYTVVEVLTRQRYPASVRNLRPATDPAERGRLLGRGPA